MNTASSHVGLQPISELEWRPELWRALAVMALGLLLSIFVPWLGVIVLLGGFAWVLARSLPVAAAAFIVLGPIPFDVVVSAHKIYWSDMMALMMLLVVLYRLRPGRATLTVSDANDSWLRRVANLFFPASYRWALVFLLGLSVLSLASALSHSGTVIKILEYTEFFSVIIGIFRFSGRSETVWKLYLYALVASASLLSLYGFGQFLFGAGPISHQISIYHVRAESLFGQPNPFGGFEADLFPLVAAVAALGPKELPKRWLTAGLVVITLGVVSSYSRGAWVADIGAVFFMGLMIWLLEGRRPLRSLLPYAIGIPVVAFIVIDLIGKIDLKPLYHLAISDPGAPARVLSHGVRRTAVIKRTPASTSTVLAHANPMTKIFSLIGAVIHPHKYYDVQQRLLIWQSAWQAFVHHPVLGVGLGNFHLYIQHHRPRGLVGGIPPMAHNLYLEWGADLGIGGFIAGFWLEWRWVASAIAAVRQTLRTKDPLWTALTIGAFGTIVAFIIQNLVDLLIDQGVVLPFLLAVALVVYVLGQRNPAGVANR